MSRVRVTVTLSPGVLSRVEQAAVAAGMSRSGIIEQWLTLADRELARRALDHAIARYYDEATEQEQVENRQWARFATRSFMVRESRPKPKKKRAVR